ncbi:hypothetical protein IQ266_18465 [filamentous cyanobacterium LEGE 11480]|uniref:Delta-60 repeat domain-containing protein n=1 Tax=Romeriopsis navalis LEGE 11480 TaxID=2777977 RepID=A0A928VSG6_9CYAN|nr:hypothetical protein [Romeriopsis navalis]MBE9031720.1 hypothetical protein [Romeriopsis navalis LEGE 11480]
MQRWHYPVRTGGQILAAVALLATTTVGATAQTAPRVQQKTHTLDYGTYLGGVGHDQARGVDFTSDNSVVACGNFANLQTRGAQVRTALGADVTSAAKLLKLSATGQTVLTELSLGDRIDDCQMIRHPGGNKYRDRLVVSGTFGVAVVSPSNMRIVWSAALDGPAGNGRSEGGQTRSSIDNQGQVATLRNNVVSLFNHKGQLKRTYSIDRSFANDIAMDPYRSQLYVVGFANRRNVNDSNNPVQMPFMYALDTLRLGFLWRTWDYDTNLLTPSADPNSAPNNNMADGRIYRVTVGGDGQVAVLGETAGGNSVFRWNGKDFTTPTLIKYDPNSDTYNSNSAHMLFFGKVDANTGVVIAGQNAVPRLDPDARGRANAFRARDGAIVSDQAGNLIIGGISAYGTPERAENNFAGEFVAPYQGDDMILLQVAADLQSRQRWTPFARQPGGGGVLSAVAVKEDRLAVFGSSTFGSLMTTPNSLVPQPFDPEKNDDRQDAYLGVLRDINQ